MATSDLEIVPKNDHHSLSDIFPHHLCFYDFTQGISLFEEVLPNSTSIGVHPINSDIVN